MTGQKFVKAQPASLICSVFIKRGILKTPILIFFFCINATYQMILIEPLFVVVGQLFCFCFSHKTNIHSEIKACPGLLPNYDVFFILNTLYLILSVLD